MVRMYLHGLVAALGLATVAGAASVATGLGVGTAHAAPEDFAGGTVVFARGEALWRTDAKGKGPAVEVVRLAGPASAVRAIRSDRAGTVLVVDVAGAWMWARLPAAGAAPAVLTALPCAAGAPLEVAELGDAVICGGPDAATPTLMVRLDDGAIARREVPVAGTRVVGPRGQRELIWAGPDGVWASSVKKRSTPRAISAEAPLRGFLPSPDGSHAVGVFRETVVARFGSKKGTVQGERDTLFQFALDGKAVRRRTISDGVALAWSWDSQWVLMQDGAKACVVRGVGGQYKCWKGYTAVSISPDGAWALVLGPRGGSSNDDDDDKHRGDEDAGGSGSAESGGTDGAEGNGAEASAAPADVPVIARPRGPQSLFRARLGGARTERPALVETIVDGAALWLPAPPAAAPPAPPAAPAAVTTP